jgi:hypothetical protein
MRALVVIAIAIIAFGCQKKTEASPTATTSASAAAAPAPASTSERGTPAEAKAMLDKAVAHYESVGRKQALADFNARKPPFFDRDLYVVCIGPDHIEAANGGFPQYVGVSADALKDADGKPLGRSLVDAANKGGDSVRYRWVNPVSGKTEPKVTFVKKVASGGGDVLGVGAYGE